MSLATETWTIANGLRALAAAGHRPPPILGRSKLFNALLQLVTASPTKTITATYEAPMHDLHP